MVLVFYLIFVFIACDYGIVLFKEPSVENKPVPEVPKRTVTPVEHKTIYPPKGI